MFIAVKIKAQAITVTCILKKIIIKKLINFKKMESWDVQLFAPYSHPILSLCTTESNKLSKTTVRETFFFHVQVFCSVGVSVYVCEHLHFLPCLLWWCRPFTYDVHLQALQLLLVLLSSHMYPHSSSGIFLRHTLTMPRSDISPSLSAVILATVCVCILSSPLISDL